MNGFVKIVKIYPEFFKEFCVKVQFKDLQRYFSHENVTRLSDEITLKMLSGQIRPSITHSYIVLLYAK